MGGGKRSGNSGEGKKMGKPWHWNQTLVGRQVDPGEGTVLGQDVRKVEDESRVIVDRDHNTNSFTKYLPST